MPATLFADAFGRLTPIPERVAPDLEFRPAPRNPLDGYLWGAFRNRSEHMRWSVREGTGTSHLWNVEEAELTYHLEPSRIGFAQVGLEVNPATPLIPAAQMIDEEPPPGIDRSQGDWVAARLPTRDDAGPPTNPVIAISPLIQCLDDSLRWFGQTDVSAYQVTGYDLRPEPRQYLLGSVREWFSVVIPTAVTPALVTVASDQRGDSLVTEVLNRIEGLGADFFEIGPLVPASEALAAGLDWDWIPWARGDTGIAASLPEWSTAAVGWLIGTVFEAALSLESAPQALSVRVARTVHE
ncbi:MAG: hypothetical protein OXS30_07570 [Chloroflexota bacterium]|nr:hypothetical protein [Chloroflexota bacterium]